VCSALGRDRLVLELVNISFICDQHCEIVDACYDGVISTHINVLTKETRLNDVIYILTKETRLNDVIYKVWRYNVGKATCFTNEI